MTPSEKERSEQGFILLSIRSFVLHYSVSPQSMQKTICNQPFTYSKINPMTHPSYLQL